jgi:hypothetical protein
LLSENRVLYSFLRPIFAYSKFSDEEAAGEKFGSYSGSFDPPLALNNLKA